MSVHISERPKYTGILGACAAVAQVIAPFLGGETAARPRMAQLHLWLTLAFKAFSLPSCPGVCFLRWLVVYVC